MSYFHRNRLSFNEITNKQTNKNTTKLWHAGIAIRKPSNFILSTQAENKKGKFISKGQYDKVALVSKVGW